MFETGMSALVLKICSEYAKALGLNFPPCVQQEINAIAQYVDLHTVKDLKVEQNGSVVTITCYTEGEQEKVFTVTLPEVNVDVLFNLIKGSSSVVVDKSEDGTHLVVRLDKSQEVQYVHLYGGRTLSTDQLNILKANKNNQIIYYGGVKYYFKFAYEKTSSEWIYTSFYNGIVTLTVNMTTGSAIFDTESGGGKLYRHDVKITNITEGSAEYFKMSFLSTSESKTTDINQIVDQNDFKSIVDVISYIQIVKFSGSPVCFPLSFAFGNFEGVIYSEGEASLYQTYYQNISVANAGSSAPANITHTDTVTPL